MKKYVFLLIILLVLIGASVFTIPIFSGGTDTNPTERLTVTTEITAEPTETSEITTEPTAKITTESTTEIMQPTLKIAAVPTENVVNINKNTTKSVNVPIFMYHTSMEETPAGNLGELYVKPSEFEKQLQYLNYNGYTTCTFDDYENLVNIKNPVMLTFDDGYKAIYTEIYPLLKQYNCKITIFMIKNHIGSELSEQEMKEMSDSGLVKFESHTVSHPSLVKTSSNLTTLDNELKNSKAAIEVITGKNVLAIAYPNGEYNEKVKEYSAKYYKYGLRKDGGMNNTSIDSYELKRIRVNRSTSLNSFASNLL